MKNFVKQLSAILTAAIMTFSAAGISVSAKNDAKNFTGWVNSNDGWQYLSNGSLYKTKSRSIDGVVYDFSSNGYCFGRYTGLRTEDSVTRRYSEGLPYTGWTKGKDGSRKYFLDGYAVTGDFQIGNKVYSFGSDGVYTGNARSLTLTASCESKVSSDTEKISVTLKNLDGRYYEYGVLMQMERWEKGKWVSCFQEYKDENGAVLAYPAISFALTKKGETDTLDFNPQTYTNFNFTEGYYRIPIGCNIGSGPNREQYDVYAMFEAVPPIETKMSEDVFVCPNNQTARMEMTLQLNSDKAELQAEELFKTADLEIHYKTESGWKVYDDMEWGIGYDEENKSIMELDSEAPAGEGYYRVVLTLDGKKYTDYFRIENIPVVTWLDEYSLKNDSITVSCTVYNRNKKPLGILTNITELYKKENGEWKSMQEKAGLYDCIDVIPEYTTLEQYQKTDVSFKLSEYYDTAKLEAGDYAVSIGGIGFAEFRLTDEKQKASEFPFANLKSEDIKEIRLAFYLSYGKPWKMSIKDGDCLKRSIDCLRQFKLNGEVKDHTNYDGGMLEVVVRYKNNTKKTLSFQISNEVVFNGKNEYYCNGYAYSALYDMLIENIDADIEDYYG